MPDEIDPKDLIYHLHVMQKLEIAEAAIVAGDILDHDEVVRVMDAWPE
jgi:hypothetical protein